MFPLSLNHKFLSLLEISLIYYYTNTDIDYKLPLIPHY